MVQIVNPTPRRDPGGEFAQALGSSLNQALTILAQNKLANYQAQQDLARKLQFENVQKQQAQTFRQPGLAALFPEQQAKALSTLEPELLKPVITENIRSSKRLAETGPGIQTIAPDLSADQASKIGRLPPGVQQLWYRNYLENPTAATEALNNLPQEFAPRTVQDFAKENVSLSKAPKLKNAVVPQLQAQAQPVPVEAKPEFPSRKNVSDYMREGFSKTEAQNFVKSDIKKAETEEEESQNVIKDVLKQQKASKENLLTLKKMEKLIDKGKLPPQALYSLIKDLKEKSVSPAYSAGALGAAGASVGKYVGGPTGAVVGGIIGGTLGLAINPVISLAESGIKSKYPDTDQFEKLSNSFIRGAKDMFGSRVTDLDLKIFLTTIPNLTQTENGKRQIIDNLRIFNEAAQVRGQVLKDILKETHGKKPSNLALLVEERSQKELDKLAEKFLENIPEVVKERDESPKQWPWQEVLPSLHIQG